MVKESLDTPEMLQIGQNVQSDEIIASKNAKYKPSELTQRKLQGEDSADAQWTPSSERYQETTKSPTGEIQVAHDKMAHGAATLYTSTTDSEAKLGNSNRGEYYLNEEYQRSKQVPKGLQNESNNEECKPDGEFKLN